MDYFPPTRPCVGSGMCCKIIPCGYGQWNEARTQCASLEVREILPGDITVYKCGKYDEIKDQPGADFMPAFGAGCCASIGNTNRQAILKHHHETPRTKEEGP